MKRKGKKNNNISGTLSSLVFAVLIVPTISYFAAFPCARIFMCARARLVDDCARSCIL